MSADILAEHARSQPLRQPDIDVFLADGVPPLALAQSCFGDFAPIAKDRVGFDGARFEYGRHRATDAVLSAYVLPALDRFGVVIDIVAFRRGRIATWLGRADMLGGEQPFLPRVGDDALDVNETVLDWLRAGRRGVVILNPQRAAGDLRLAGPLRVDTVEMGLRLRQALTIPAPRIVVRENAGTKSSGVTA